MGVTIHEGRKHHLEATVAWTREHSRPCFSLALGTAPDLTYPHIPNNTEANGGCDMKGLSFEEQTVKLPINKEKNCALVVRDGQRGGGRWGGRGGERGGGGLVSRVRP